MWHNGQILLLTAQNFRCFFLLHFIWFELLKFIEWKIRLSDFTNLQFLYLCKHWVGCRGVRILKSTCNRALSTLGNLTSKQFLKHF